MIEDIKPLSEDMFAFKMNGKWGYLDKNLDIVIKPQFAYAGDFKNGISMVQIDRKIFNTTYIYYAIINKKGEIISPLCTQIIFEDDLIICRKNDLYGVFTLDGKPLKFVYSKIKNGIGTKIIHKRGKDYVTYDIIMGNYESVKIVNAKNGIPIRKILDGVYEEVETKNTTSHIDKNGDKLYEYPHNAGELHFFTDYKNNRSFGKYKSIGNFEEHNCCLRAIATDEYKIYIIDENGNSVKEYNMQDYSLLRKDYLFELSYRGLYRFGHKIGYIIDSNKKLLLPNGEALSDFFIDDYVCINNYIYYRISKDCYVVDTLGNLCLKGENIAGIKESGRNDLLLIIDYDLKERFVKPKGYLPFVNRSRLYDICYPFDGDYAICANKKINTESNKTYEYNEFSIIDIYGRVINNYPNDEIGELEYIENHSSSGFYIAKHLGSEIYYLLDLNGEEINRFVNCTVEFFHGYIVTCERDDDYKFGKYTIYDTNGEVLQKYLDGLTFLTDNLIMTNDKEIKKLGIVKDEFNTTYEELKEMYKYYSLNL